MPSRKLLIAVAIGVVFAAVGTLGTHAHGQPKSNKPLKTWGPLRAVVQTTEGRTVLFFEDANGTIRTYDISVGGLLGEVQRE